MNPKAIADNYEKEYGFMCINALMRNAGLMVSIHATDMLPEMKAIYDVLVQRGWKVIMSQQEYDLGCQIYGIPEAFQEESRT